MGAHGWRVVLLIELVLAGLVASAALDAWPGTTLPAVLGFVAVPAAVDVAFVAFSYAMGHVLGGSGAVPWRIALRATAGEAAAFALAKAGMAFRAGESASDAAGPAGTRPVLLIHGIYCNRGVWPAMRRALAEAGFGPVESLSLEPLLAGIDSHVPAVERRVEALRRGSPDGRVAIVAHSMGGLVARAYVRARGADAVRVLVTLGTPHHGSELARLGFGQAAREMRPGSRWLADLNAAQEGALPLPVTSVYSPADNLVVPVTSPALAGARLRDAGPVGHFRLVSSPGVARHVIQALGAACP